MHYTFNTTDLEVGYPSFSIKKVSFSLHSGGLVGLVGGSGCGKSTLIKTLIGQKDALGGSMELLCEGSPENIKTAVGYSPQENALFTYLTLGENLSLFSDLYGVSAQELASRKKEILRRLQLEQYEDVLINKFSGGMKKRADLAVSLIHKPAVIILDEPFTGLDVGVVDFLWTLLHNLARSGRIVIVASHHLDDIEHHCQEIFLIHNNSFHTYKKLKKDLKFSGSLTDFLKDLIVKGAV